jgi:hypothetical protein
MSYKEKFNYWNFKRKELEIIKKHNELQPSVGMKNNKYLDMKTCFFYEFGDCYFDEPTVNDLKKEKYEMI